MRTAESVLTAAHSGVARPWGRWGLRATAISYLALIIVLPLSAIVATGFRDGLRAFWNDITNPTAFAALRLTLTVAVLTTVINAVMGTLTAYALVRYSFPGRRLLNGLVDIPFAIPTLVTGVMLVVLYGPQQPLGAWLQARGIQVIFAAPGIVLALLLVTYPFVIRAVQPVLLEMQRARPSKDRAACALRRYPGGRFASPLEPGSERCPRQ